MALGSAGEYFGAHLLDTRLYLKNWAGCTITGVEYGDLSALLKSG
jgi:hypothetical protein